jgi:hypothetical protein
MPVTKSEAQEYLANLINTGQVTNKAEAQERLAEFINTDGASAVQESAQIAQPVQELPEGVMIPEQRELSPIEQEDVRFEEQIQPIQDIAAESRAQKAMERKARREAGEATTGEAIEDVLFTRDVTESMQEQGPLGEISGLASLPARALGALVGEGDIQEEQAKLFRPAISALNEWAGDPADRSLATKAAALMGNIALETASDPTAIAGALRTAAQGALKAAGKTATKEQVDNLVEQAVKQSEGKIADVGKKKLRATDIDPEKLLVDAGGGEEVIKRLKDKDIGITSAGEINIPQSTLDQNIDKLKKVRIEEFDITDKIESTVIPLSKKEFIIKSIGDEVIEGVDVNKVANDIVRAGNNNSKVTKILRDAGFESPKAAAPFMTKLGDRITGAEARELITGLNRKIGDPSRGLSLSKEQLNKVKKGIEDELRLAVGGNVPESALDDYIALRELGTEKFATKSGKLRNILKRKGDKTLDEKASINAMQGMIDDAMSEFKLGKPGKSVDNLREIDAIAGTDMANTARDLALAERFNLNIRGEISAIPKDVKKPLKGSVAQRGAILGKVGAVEQAVQNTAADVINALNAKKVKSAVNAISREKGKLKIKKENLQAALRDIDEGKKLLLSEINKGTSIRLFEVLTSKGIITARQVAQQLGRESTQSLIDQAEKSNNNKIRAYGRKLEKEMPEVDTFDETIDTTGQRDVSGKGTTKELRNATKILRQKEDPQSIRRAISILEGISKASDDYREAQGLIEAAKKRLRKAESL